MGPIEVRGKPGTLGRVDQRVLLAWITGGAAALLAIYLVTKSEAVALVALYFLVLSWRPMQRRAAAERPLPAYPDPPPSFHPLAWQRWGWLPICALLGAAIGELANRIDAGIAFWAFVGAVAPFCYVQNRYGVQQRPKSRSGWLRRILRRPRADGSG